MNSIVIKYYKSPVGELIIGSYKNQLCICDWKYRKMRVNIDQRIQKILKSEFIEGTSIVIEQTIQQLDEYFNSQREEFDLPLLFAGTDFQKKVWNELQKIPSGKTISYLDLSLKLKNKDAIRAVASANGANAISIIVPCHRVIGSNGKLVGYAGGLPAKKFLLKLENVIYTDEQLQLF